MVKRDPETNEIIGRHDPDGVYEFNRDQHKEAHQSCKDGTEDAMKDGDERIIVSNTFTQEWEMEEYFKLAEKYDYRVYCLIVENRHGGVNVHGVPQDVLNKMERRFQTKLI